MQNDQAVFRRVVLPENIAFNNRTGAVIDGEVRIVCRSPGWYEALFVRMTPVALLSSTPWSKQFA